MNQEHSNKQLETLFKNFSKGRAQKGNEGRHDSILDDEDSDTLSLNFDKNKL